MDVITTVSSDQEEILRNIQELHNGGEPFQADLTWGSGGFWRHSNYRPTIRMHFQPPSAGANVQGDLRHLPFQSGSLKSILVDPPFIHAPGKTSIIGNRFGGYPSQRALMDLYMDAAEEIHDALKPGGLLVWKCQDITESGKQVWNHLYIMVYCIINPVPLFDLIDLFILVKKGQIVGHNHANQQHARRAHSYFLVLRRRK